MGVRGCGLGYDHHVPKVLLKKLAPSMRALRARKWSGFMCK